MWLLKVRVMFAINWTRVRLKYLSRVLMACGALFFGWYWWALPVSEQLLKHFDSGLKIVGLVIGPLLAISSFFMAKYDRIELHENTVKLGMEQQKAADERTKADEALRQAAAAQREAVKALAVAERERAAAGAAQIEAESERKKATEQAERAIKLQTELEGVTKGSDELWKLRKAAPFPFYKEWITAPGATVVSIGNLKGGVGKTTIAANFAAFAAETLDKRVLEIDLDYQGTLSNMMLQAFGIEQRGSVVNELFQANAGLAAINNARTHLIPAREEISASLEKAWIVSADYDFAAFENRLLLSWLANTNHSTDVRYLLANALLQPEVRAAYDLIIIDTPPRVTIGSINALIASHYFFVPTMLNKLSVEAVPQYIRNVKAIKTDLDLPIELAGVVGNLTRTAAMSENEQRYFAIANNYAAAGWGADPNRAFTLPQTLPRRVAISDATGIGLPYLVHDRRARLELRQILDPLFADMSARIQLTQADPNV